MAYKISGNLEVGTNDRKEVVINLAPETVAGFSLKTGGHLEFSPDQARNLAILLMKKADECESGKWYR